MQSPRRPRDTKFNPTRFTRGISRNTGHCERRLSRARNFARPRRVVLRDRPPAKTPGWLPRARLSRYTLAHVVSYGDNRTHGKCAATTHQTDGRPWATMAARPQNRESSAFPDAPRAREDLNSPFSWDRNETVNRTRRAFRVHTAYGTGTGGGKRAPGSRGTQTGPYENTKNRVGTHAHSRYVTMSLFIIIHPYGFERAQARVHRNSSSV